ncbi:MAG: hypothetical protein JWQ42_5054 [Edaphobacter sp.]|nr:hypothetical protein [Edaphobacter sp.]
MRLNAPISAFLAFAVLSVLPATLLAKPAHRTAHKATTAKPVSTKHAHSKAAAAAPTTSRSARKSKRHGAGRLRQEEAPSPPTVNRVRGSRHARSSSRAGARYAFQRDKALAIKTPPSNVDETAAPTHARSRETASPATATSVVNVVRETTDRPQWESVEETAATPMILPTLYNKRGRLIVPPPLKGSREILLRQNQVADRDGLDRIQNDDDLIDMRNKMMLVALPLSSGLQVDERLPANRRYSRPWTAQFLSTLARAHYARFHSPLQVNSAVRTVEFQQRLLRTNGNAAPADGETASPHLTGQAVDIAKHGLSLTEIAWLRGYLLPLVQEGKIDVEEEFQQACFHISVYKRYLPAAKTPPREIATSHRSGTTALAAAIR